MNEYYSIGEMAKLNFISIEALRYYDKIGLLKPSFVNAENGYRYYTYRDFLFLDQVQYLKNFGMPLSDIKKQLEYSSINNSLDLYQAQLEEVNAKLDGLLNLRKRIEHNLFNLKSQAELRKKTEVKILSCPERYMVTIDKTVSSMEEYEVTIRALSHHLYNNNFIGMGDFMGIKKIEDLRRGEFTRSIAIGTMMEKPVEGLKVKNIPGGDYVSIYHSGSTEEISRSYEQLIKLIDKSELSVDHQAMEIYLIDQMTSCNPGEYLTQIMIPLK